MLLRQNRLTERLHLLFLPLQPVFLRFLQKYSAGNTVFCIQAWREKKTGSILSKLPDSYVVLQNVSITKNGKHTEMDNLIISPYGICIVEVKNHNGCIQGNQKDEMWTQHKTGQKGTPYTSMFKNPLKQLGFQKYLLSTLLKEHNMDLWINGAVFFSGAEGLETDCDHVFASEQDMIFWIMNDQQIKLSDHEIMQIQKLLSQAV